MNLHKVKQDLTESGISIVESYLSSESLTQLKVEFDFVLEHSDDGISFLHYSLGKGAVIHKLKCDFSNLPVTKSVFYSETFESISNDYLGVENELNKEIFVVKDVVGSKHHANDLHFDVSSTFKFFIYLTDTNEENGAFCCVPGSHKRTAIIREELGDEVSYENRYLTRKLPYTEDEVVSVNGKAGTLIIFDTDVFHKAGHVSKGERLVMRGHTRPIHQEKESENKSIPEVKNSLVKKVLKKIFK